MTEILNELSKLREVLAKAQAVEGLPIGAVVQLEKARRLLHSAITMARESPAEQALHHEQEIRQLYSQRATKWKGGTR